MKPLFPSCRLLFIKYEDGDKGYLTREEWDEFCMSVPIYIDEPTRDQMWHLMAYRRPDQIILPDFIAGWHIHDIEANDRWIMRMTKVLHLDYYDMTIQELEERMRAKSCQDATPQLDFENKDKRGMQSDLAGIGDTMLQNREGLRQVGYAPAGSADGKSKVATKALKVGGSRTRGKITITDAEYYGAKDGDSASEGGGAESSINSSDLSQHGVDSDEEEFDAGAILRPLLQKGGNGNAITGGRIVIDSDDAIKRLMNMSVEEFEHHRLKSDTEPLEDSKPATSLQKGEKEGGSGEKTDILKVRQTIREVYRNMPYSDFSALINYLLRALQTAKHSAGATYWHADDPSFSHTLGQGGTNEYTRKLLVQIGFMQRSDVYWVWQGRDGATQKGAAPVAADRLDEMLRLLKSCQTTMHTMHRQKQKFTGHFSSQH